MTPAETAKRRGIHLARSRRPDLAEAELRRALALEPEDPEAHSALSLTLSNLDRHAEALDEADRAVALAPDDDYGHYARSVALLELGRQGDAADAAREALRLNPDAIAARIKLAAVLHVRGDLEGALAETDRALAVDPEHVTATNFRGMVLSSMGRHQEAAHAIEAALALDPDNDKVHANRGWALLYRGREPEALEAFREALRLKPGDEWARRGLIEAMKARNVAYRWLLRFGHWMGQMSRLRRWAVLVGGFVSAMTFPPFFGLYVGVVLLGWIGEPLYNTVLLTDPFGRAVLTRDEKVGAVAVAACLWGGIAVAVGGAVAGASVVTVAGVVLAAMSIPVAVVAQVRPGSRRRVGLGTAVLAAVGVAFVAFTATGDPDAEALGGCYILGILVSALIASAVKR